MIMMLFHNQRNLLAISILCLFIFVGCASLAVKDQGTRPASAEQPNPESKETTSPKAIFVASVAFGKFGEIFFIPQRWGREVTHCFLTTTGDNRFEISSKELFSEKDHLAFIQPDSKQFRLANLDNSKFANYVYDSAPVIKTFSGKKTEKIIVLTPVEKKRYKTAIPPDCIGWFYRLDSEMLIANGEGDIPIKNVIWAFRRPDGGLNLSHSGPDCSGMYATVNPDCTMQYLDPALQSKTTQGVTYYWHKRNTKMQPAFENNSPVSFASTSQEFVTILGNGQYSLEVPPIE
jgi:hypothetical protein